MVPIRPGLRRRVRLFDTDPVRAVIEAGERATEQQLPYLLRLLEAAERNG